MSRAITTYAMSGDSERLGFAIRDQSRVTRTELPHRHEFFQMRLDIAGQTHHSIGPQRRQIAPGSLTFVLPFRMHRGGRRADSRFYVINFHHRFLRPELNLDPLCLDASQLEYAPELAPFLFQEHLDFRLDGNDLVVAEEACRHMLEQSSRRRLFSVELVRANLLTLIGVACQRYERELTGLTAAGACRGDQNDTLSGIVRYVSAHLCDRISLSDVARVNGMSPNNVTRLLKKHTGKTFLQLLTERRLQKAQELLANTAMRVADIGESVGFEDNAYFARRFKQVFHVSPRAYRSSPQAPKRLEFS